MTIPFRVKKLTKTAKLPERANEGDLFDLFADDFCGQNILEKNASFYGFSSSGNFVLEPTGRILVKTGIAIELPIKNGHDGIWWFSTIPENHSSVAAFAVADIRPRSGLALKHGITVLNTPGTIDNSYRKEIGVILYNAGHEPYTICRGDKIAQMLIRPLYPSEMEVVEEFSDTGRGGFGSTGN